LTRFLGELRSPPSDSWHPRRPSRFKALGQFVTGAIGDITITITIELIVADGGLVANRNRAHGTRKADQGSQAGSTPGHPAASSAVSWSRPGSDPVRQTRKRPNQ